MKKLITLLTVCCVALLAWCSNTTQQSTKSCRDVELAADRYVSCILDANINENTLPEATCDKLNKCAYILVDVYGQSYMCEWQKADAVKAFGKCHSSLDVDSYTSIYEIATDYLTCTNLFSDVYLWQ